jgi:hypothetical protein
MPSSHIIHGSATGPLGSGLGRWLGIGTVSQWVVRSIPRQRLTNPLQRTGIFASVI